MLISKHVHCNSLYLWYTQYRIIKRVIMIRKPKNGEKSNYWSVLYRDSANAVPTTKNYAPELPTFGAITRVNPTGVQWKGLTLGEPPSGSR